MDRSRKVALITGASRGIGAATARLAARRGYDVCIAYRSDAQAAEAVAADARREGATAITAPLDLASDESIRSVFALVDSSFGRLDALVNNAAIIGSMGAVTERSRADLETIFSINTIGAFLMSGEAVRRMSKAAGGRGGAIVNVSSRSGQLGSPNRAHYAASKSGVDSLTVSLALEVATDGIRVNAVSPGPIMTDMHHDAGPDRLKALIARVPMQRIGTAEEAAQSIMWLLSDSAAYITGTVLVVSGGR